MEELAAGAVEMAKGRIPEQSRNEVAGALLADRLVISSDAEPTAFAFSAPYEGGAWKDGLAEMLAQRAGVSARRLEKRSILGGKVRRIEFAGEKEAAQACARTFDALAGEGEWRAARAESRLVRSGYRAAGARAGWLKGFCNGLSEVLIDANLQNYPENAAPVEEAAEQGYLPLRFAETAVFAAGLAAGRAVGRQML